MFIFGTSKKYNYEKRTIVTGILRHIVMGLFG